MIAGDWMLLQTWQLTVSLLAGFSLGLCYDLYRGILARERRFRQDYWWRDLLFGLCAILLSLLLWFSLTDGSLRLSVFLWMAGAVLFYRWHLSPLLHPEKWLQQKRKKPAPKIKKSSKKPAKKPKQWNITMGRKALLLCQSLQNRRRKREEESPEEKI